jgi:hypothetical protein
MAKASPELLERARALGLASPEVLLAMKKFS